MLLHTLGSGEELSFVIGEHTVILAVEQIVGDRAVISLDLPSGSKLFANSRAVVGSRRIPPISSPLRRATVAGQL